MAEFTLLTDYGRYKAGTLLTDEAGDPIASLIANGVPVVPTVAALRATAQQVRDSFGGSSHPEWQASAALAALTCVMEEGTMLNARPSINFLGAGVTAADDPANNRINVTIAAEAVTGWTDGGTLVYPTTATDDVAMGVQAMEGTERLRVVNSVPLVAAFESTDAGAVGCTMSTHHRSASPGDNDVVMRWSIFGEADAGAPTKTEMARIDVLVSDVSDTTEDAVINLYAMDSGALTLAARFTAIGGSASWLSTLAAGAVPAFRVRATADYADGQPVFSVEDNAGAATLLRIEGDGDCELTSVDAGALGPELRLYQNSASPGDGDVVGRVGFYGMDDNVAPQKTRFARIDGVAVDVSDTTEDGRIDFYAMVAGAETLAFQCDGVGLAMPKTGTAAAAASQADSRRVQLTASMWNAAGLAEEERDFDVYASPSTLLDDETTAVARLRIDFEGNFLLAIQPDTAAGAAQNGVQFIVDGNDGVNTAFDFRVQEDYGAGSAVFQIVDNNAAAPALLFAVRGTGLANAGAGYMVAGTQVVTAQQINIADVLDGADIGPDNTLRADVRALKAMLRVHGLMAAP